jgi:hypothetical protein
LRDAVGVTDGWEHSLSLRLASLALDAQGRLTDDLVTGLAVRGTLLTDLAFRGRVSDVGDAIEVDDQPTGFIPADRLLAAPVEDLTHLLRKGNVDQRDLAAEHLRRGNWSLGRSFIRRRYVDHQAAGTRRDEQLVASPPHPVWSPPDAALAAIASTLGLLSTPREYPADELLAAAADVRWLVELVVQEVDRAIARGRFMARGVSLADGTPG